MLGLLQHKFKAKPYRTADATHEDRYYCREADALNLLDTHAPAAQVGEVGAKRHAVRIVDAERSQERGNSLQNYFVLLNTIVLHEYFFDYFPEFFFGYHRQHFFRLPTPS